MAVLVEKNKNGERTEYILIGTGRIPSNYGGAEEPYVVVCDKTGKIKILQDCCNNIKVVDIDGKTPSEILE